MKKLTLLISITALACLTACGSSGGYYDANGNWVAPPNSTHEGQRVHSPSPGVGQSDSKTRYVAAPADHRVVKTVTTYSYDRPGYYDYNGYYITETSTMAAPGMYPPRGMCRVWFPERDDAAQPPIESCDGIRSRVPAGAYVIYGG